MRRVTFKVYIPLVMEDVCNDEGKKTHSARKAGTGCWSENYCEIGFFHQWGSAYEESSEGFGNYTVAIVEMNDGTVTEVLPSHIKFLD